MLRREWKIVGRTLAVGGRTLVMGILNVTPDSFSDGGRFFDMQTAVARAEEMVVEGADILDVGGESTRPGAAPVSVAEEIRRVVPVVEAVAHNIAVPISVDTTKAEVARIALQSGAEIINDISGLRFDSRLADEAARAGAGLILMHSRGTLETMHNLEPVADVLTDVIVSLHRSIAEAERRGVERESIALDPGIGFSKSAEQNVELLANLSKLASEFAEYPILVGTSRKRFIGALLGGVPAAERLHGTMATVTAAVLRGAAIVRVHDVLAAVQTVRVADAIKAVTGDG
ncbi:MAG TPA: dihydropteroate synthase [Pyrinomonadaceae bacterium]|jgi:dihydropteroate synthase|nr:dihydropteroate synthase [Pyrinomonadaceae bacterium]